MSNITSILCPVDFSEGSLRAFRYADDLASSLGADITVLNAFDIPQSYDAQGQWVPADPSIATELQAVTSQHDNVTINHLTHAGPAGDVICWAAENQECNLIVMGTHGRSGIKRVLFGSTAEHVLRHARCPVLTIREQDKHATLLSEPMVLPHPAPPYM